MATVTSLTQARIEELMSGWELVGFSQDEINALIVQLSQSVETQKAVLIEFEEVVVPLIKDELATGAIAVGDVKDNLLPQLQSDLAQAREQVSNLEQVVVPSLQQDVENATQNLIDAPKVYIQPEAPTNPDDEGRYLVVGDTWHDEDDNNMVRLWNGVEWTTFKLDIPDLSLTVKKFRVSSHQIY